MEVPAHERRQEEREEGARKRREEDQTPYEQRPSSSHDKQSETKRREERKDAEFVDTHRATLIQRVVMVMVIADVMLQRGMIHDELYSNIAAARTRQDQMRELYNALTSEKVKSAFFQILQENDPYLVQDLGGTLHSPQRSATLQPGPSRPHDRQSETERREDKGVTSQTPQSSGTQPWYKVLSRPFAQWKAKKVMRRVKKKLKDSLKKKFRVVFEGHTDNEETLLNSIYTELYITDGVSESVNTEHEIRQLESLQKSSATPMNCNDIFKPRPGKERSIRTVMTKGIAGVGKTFSVQKFILDWAEGKANQDIDFIFVLPFRELNLIQEEYSLHDLLCYFHPELTEITDANMLSSCTVLFIFDGLDESRLSFEFRQNKRVCDVMKTSSVDKLLTNLIEGHLLPSALIWVTTRPAAANKIERRFINQMTEVRGFTDEQKEQYFRNKFREDEDLANEIIKHIKNTRSLYIMCYIPIMCCITAKVLEHMLKNNKGDIPSTLTGMYIHFLITQTGLANAKYHGENEQDRQRILESSEDFILKLAQLAFQQLQKGNIIFYEEDLRKCDISVNEAAVTSGLCTQLLKKDEGLYEKKVYSFVHLSFQEFLAALYVFFCCVSKNINALDSFLESVSPDLPLHEILKRVVVKALQSDNGYFDMFLRFLLGISLESNQNLLRGLLPQTENSSETVEEMKTYLRKPDVENISPARQVNLFLCLTEMKDSLVHEGIHKFLMLPDRDRHALSGDQCSALANALLMSDVLDEMDQRKYNIGPLERYRLIPAVRKCRKAVLISLRFSTEDCESLTSILQSPDSHLRELHLSNTTFYDEDGLRVLYAAMRGPHCQLERLRLDNCFCCRQLASALSSNFHLRELDLSLSDLRDSGVKLLFDGLKGPNCILEILRFSFCRVTEKGCAALAVALRSNFCHLKELDVSHNDLRDSGVKLLCDGLKSPNCRLEFLRLSFCGVTAEGCAALATALRSNSHLRELNLSFNHPGDSGVKLFSDPLCRLEKLNVEPNEEIWLKPQLLKKYACDLTLDPNTAHRTLSLSEDNKTVKWVNMVRPELCPDNPERFDEVYQVLCGQHLTGRHYWEVEWEAVVVKIGVTYNSIRRKGDNDVCGLGNNDKSWSLVRLPLRLAVQHNSEQTYLPVWLPPSRRVGIYLDWPSGILSFYSVYSDTMTHMHTFHTTFREPLCPGFSVWGLRSSASLCEVE